MRQHWNNYDSQGFFDEMMYLPYQPRSFSYKLMDYFKAMDRNTFKQRVAESEVEVRERGITFTVYSDAGNIDREWPFDIIPRMIPRSEWKGIEQGLKQRIKALNYFIEDIYNEANIIKAGLVPEQAVLQSKGYRPYCQGMKLPHGAWAHICGSDLVRDHEGTVFVLEDNLRVPSGVAYMLENRKTTKRVLPELFRLLDINPVSDYPTYLAAMLRSLRPDLEQPNMALLTPGIFNSAYYEHATLAQQAGLTLLEGADLVVKKDDYVYMKTIHGLERVDVIYRRIDDEFIDPEVFKNDSMLGVPGIMRAWKAGKVAIANAPGCGVADDKVLYAFVPDMIRFYLDEEPLLANVPTKLCHNPKELDYVLQHLPELVVKPASESGGYGMLVGPQSTSNQIQAFKQLLMQNPENYIAQPTLKLSVAPTFCNDSIEPRHIDLRPFILSGSDCYVTPGGLTRVALVAGSLVVNSSQGGGSKDTWVVDDSLFLERQ